MLTRIIDWIDERIKVRAVWETVTNRPIPGGASWFYVLGTTLLFVFVLQMLTGIFLAMYYVPTPDHAYASVKYIQEGATLGSFVRGLHHWGASFMMVLIAIHMIRVFTFGSYKKPREIVWLLGVVLITLVFGFAFTGYLLPWDQKAYWATVVGTNIFGTFPVVGGLLLKIVRGGVDLGNMTLSRFFAVHTYILPWSLAVVAGLHVFIMELAGPGGKWDPALNTPERTEPLFPNQIFKDTIVIFAVFVALAVLAAVSPAGLEPQADPTDTTYNPRPEWYFYFVFQILRIFQGRFEVVGTFVIPTIAGILLVLLPFLDRRPDRIPAKRKALLSIGGLAVAGVITLTIMGAVAPFVQGPSVTSPSVLAGRLIYEKGPCSSCHTINGEGGKIGPDLTHVGSKRSRDWLMRHFKDPKAVSPGSIMPKVTLPDKELNELTDYIMSLK
jgi:ubiquinol-cytochrome c reductase cytochrome b subunit